MCCFKVVCRQQGASTRCLQTTLKQHITNQITQGLGEQRHASLNNATGQWRLLPALQLQLTTDGLIRQQRDRIRLDADGNTARAQRPQQLLTQGGQLLGHSREHATSLATGQKLDRP